MAISHSSQSQAHFRPRNPVNEGAVPGQATGSGAEAIAVHFGNAGGVYVRLTMSGVDPVTKDD